MKHILIIIGTRPEAIKMIPLIIELKKRDNFKVTICNTGQHKEMIDQALESFSIVPDINLSVMSINQGLEDLTSSLLTKVGNLLNDIQPDLVLVHGDTTTAFAASLASFYKQIPVGHIEAGLRTYNVYSPFPEEFNRRAISLIAKYNFAPTQTSKYNLIHEGVDPDSIYVTGNTCIDTLQYTIKDDYKHELLDWAADSNLILVTLHRRENFGTTYENVLKTIKQISEKYEDIKIIFPVHLNPNIRSKVYSILGNSERIKLIDPLDVVDFHNFMKASYIILTDSGGLQEEASYLHTPTLVLRDTTERPEGVGTGTIKLIGTDVNSILKYFTQIYESKILYTKMKESVNPYGEGNSCMKISSILSTQPN